MAEASQLGKRRTFVEDLAPDAVMTATILRHPVHGKEAIGKIVAAVGALFSSQTSVFAGTMDGRSLMEYDAVLRSGEEIHGTAVATRNAAGQIDRVNVSHSPLPGALALAEGVRDKLKDEFGRKVFI
jgi:uncharacterized protein with ACT and thioredoxin-like domain